MNFLVSEKKIIAIIIIVISILYFQSNFNQLIFLDDDTLVYNKFAGMSLNEKITLSFTSNYLGGHYYRPITLMSFVMDSILGGQSYFIYHFTNFIIHLITSVLIFLIIKNFGYSLLNSFIIALLFALNPIHINAVGWIAGRGDLLAAFFSTAALLIYLKFIKQNKLLLLFLVSSLLFLALLSKEVSLLVPFLFLFLYFIEKKELSLDKNSIGVLLMIVIVFGSYYLLRGIFLSEVHIDKFSFTTYYKNILVLPETISKFFIPIGIKALSGIELITSISGTIIFVLLLMLPLRFTSINKYKYYFGFLWFIILLLPGMVFRTMEQDGFYYWDCRSYLPSVGLMFVAAEILQVIELHRYKLQCFTLIIIFLFTLGISTFVKIKMYENPITYWNAVKADYPSRVLPYIGLYNYYNYLGNNTIAEKQLLKALEIKPKDFTIRQMLIDFYLKHNEKQKALFLVKDTLERKISNSNYFIENFVLLSVELDQLDAIDKLLVEYAADKKMMEMIRKIIIQEAESLKNNGDSLKSNLLLEKFQRLTL